MDKFLSNEVAPKLHLFLDTPRGNDNQTPALFTPQGQLDLYNYSMAIQRYYEGNPKVEVVDSWSAVVDPRNHLWVDETYSNDGTHFVMPDNEGNERILGKLAMPLVQEELEDIEPIVTVRNARSLGARRQADIERTQQTILAAIEATPTSDENAEAVENRLLSNADGVDFVSIVSDMLEQRVNDDTDGEMTLAVIQQTVVAALTAYNASTGQQVADVQTAVNLLPTLTAILQDPTIVQLIANAQAARSAAEANGTALATPNNFKADTIALQAAIDTVLAELANTLKVDEPLTLTNAATNGTDTVTITRQQTAPTL